MATEIKVPVRFEVLQDSINTIKSTLANIKPESGAWRTLNTILQGLTREADKLQITMSKPFTNQSQFTNAEKSIEKMEEGLDRARIAMSRIKFSDIKLTPEQTNAFNNLKTELKSIEQEINQFKVNAKAALQNDDVWKDFMKIDPNAATRTFDQLLTMVRRKNSELQKEVQEAELALNSFKAQNENKMNNTQQLIDGKKIKDMLGEEYSNFFKTTGAFKNQDSKNSFYEWIKTNFVLDDNQIAELAKASGPKLDTVIQGMKEQLQEKLKALQLEQNSKQLKFDTNKEQLDSATKAAAAMGTAVDDLAGKQSNLKSREDELAASTQKLEAIITNAARSNDNFNNATSQMNMQLTNLKNTLGSANAQFLQMQRTTQSFNQMKMAVVNFMGFNQVLNLTKRAVRDAMNHIKELDTVMTKISIVTDMSTGDLWNQIDSYSQMAQRYGVSIKGAYEVSQIYYQQGLDTSNVMTLTNETLKLAKISGLDYAKTTDYMTTALRGFKMEMSEAATVVDVYSNLAAHTAVSQEELAVAMSKTASSMEGVGVTFQDASAMIGTMVAVTRESATNIGSAMKSIASRYGELTKDPTKLVDEDGEAMAFNKVDAALQSVGISMKTTDGQFRDFTSVIVELGEKWDQLDSVQQRYIATQFAGNRQQSRFLALVSNVDLLKQNMQYAEDSEDVGTLQALKALDSIEAKTEQVRVAYQQMYTTIGAEDIWKGFLDGAKNVMNTLNSLPKLFGKIPIGAIAMVADFVKVIKDVGFTALGGLSKLIEAIFPADLMAQKGQEAGNAFGQSVIDALHKVLPAVKEAGKEIATETGKGGEQAGKDATNPAKPTTETQQMQAAVPAENVGAEAVKQAQAEAQATGGIHIPVQIDFDLGALTAKLSDAVNISNEQIQANINFAFNLNDLDANFLPQLQSAISQIDFSLPDAQDQLQNWINSYIAQAGELGTELQDKFQQAGPNAVQGLVEGLIGSSGNATASAATIGAAVIAALNAAMGCHSPSVFAKLSGENVIAGIAEGIASAAQDAVNKASETGQDVIEALKSSMQFDDNSFELFKQGILKEIDNLGSEVTEAEKTTMRGIAQGMSLQEFLDHNAPEEFYQFAGMYQKKFIDTGMQHTYGLMDKAAAEQKTSYFTDVPKIGKEGLTEQEIIDKQNAINEINTRAQISRRTINDRLNPINTEIETLRAKQEQAKTIGMQEYLQNYRKLHNGSVPSNLDQAEYRATHSFFGAHYTEADADRLEQLEKQKNQLEKERTSVNRSAANERDAVKVKYREIAKENREKVREAEKSADNVDKELERDKQELEWRASGAKITAQNNADDAVRKADLREQEIARIEGHLEEKRDASQQIKAIEQKKAIEEIKTENENKEGRETEFTVKPQLDQAAIDAIPPEASTKITSDLAENPPKITNIEGGQEQASTTGSEISETIQENIPPVETQITDTKASEEGAEAGESFKEGAESTPPAEGKIDGTEKAAEEGTKAGETFKENVENAPPATPKIEAPQEQQQTTSPEATQQKPPETQQPQPQQPIPEPTQPPIDTTDAKVQLQSLIDKYVELGLISETEGAKQKEAINGLSTEEAQAKLEQLENSLKLTGEAAETTGNKMSKMNLGTFGSAIRMLASLTGLSSQAKGAITALGGAITLIGVVIQTVDKASKDAAKTNPWMGIAMGVMALWNGISQIIETPAEKLERLQKEAEELSNTAKEYKANYNTLDKGLKKLDELEEKRYDSAEAAEEYQTAVDDLTGKFPSLIAGFDAAGNVIIDTTNAEQVLADARQKTLEATYAAAKGEMAAAKMKRDEAKAKYEESVKKLSSETQKQADTVMSVEEQDYWELITNIVSDKYVKGSTAQQHAYQHLTEYTNKGEFGLEQFKETALVGINSNADGNLIEAYEKALEDQQEALKQHEEGSEEYNTIQQAIDNIQQYLTILRFIDEEENNTKEHSETLQDKINDLVKVTKEQSPKENKVMDKEDQLKEDLNKQMQLLANPDLDITSNEAQKIMQEINSLLIEAETLELKDGNGFFDQFEEVYTELKQQVESFISENELYQSNKKLVISAWLKEAGNWEFLTESTSGIALLTKLIDKDVGDTDWSATTEEQKESWKEQAKVFDNFWNALSEERQELFNSMVADGNNFTGEDILTEFNISSGSDLAALITDYYSESIASIRTRLNAQLSQILGKKPDQDGKYAELNFEKLEGVERELVYYITRASTNTEASVLSMIYKKYDSLKDAGYNQYASEFGTAATQLFGEISNAPQDIQKALWKLIIDTGLDTQEAIQTIQDTILNNEEYSKYVTPKNLDNLYSLTVSNVGLAIQTATSDLLENWENTSKDLKAAMSGGVSLKDADTLIAKAETLAMDNPLTINDFVLSGDKLILNYQRFMDYYNALKASTEKEAEAWQTALDNAQGISTDLLHHDTNLFKILQSDEQKAALQRIGFDLNNTKYWDYLTGDLTVDGIVALQKALVNSKEQLEYYNQAAKIAENQLLNSYERSQGLYKLDDTILKQHELESIVSGEVKLTKDQIDERAIKESVNSVYDSLISDVLSQGFDNINLDDYEGLISSVVDEQIVRDAIDFTSYEDFVRRYAALAGKTIDEINDLILEARDKDHERFSEDLIKDLTFYNDKQFQASEATMRDMANAFDIPMQQLMASGAMVFDEATRRYIVDIDKLKDEGIDLTQVDNFKQTVQESVDQMFSDTTTGIKNALKGSLNAKGVKSLMENLKGFGLDVDLAFTRTKDGYKISVDEAQKLYDELKQIDTISSEIVLDALNESIEESVTGARVLNKEIQALRATTESDDFKFMDNDIPSGQKNPLNYMESWGKALNTFRDAFDKTKHKGKLAGGVDSTYGMVEYQDWYNFANELGNLAKISGQTIKVAGIDIDGSLESTSALIQKGISSFTNVDTGKMMVNVGQMGLDFASGAAGLENNIDLGIDKLADSQIAMLDSMIQLLETIVAMEELGDIDVDENGIDFEDLFYFDEKAGKRNMDKFSDGYDKFRNYVLERIDENSKLFNKDLADSVNKTKITVGEDSFVFGDLLKLEPSELKKYADTSMGKAYAAIIAAYKQASLSNDWDPDHVLQSIKEILANTGFEGSIDLGELQLTFRQGVALERDEHGNYLVDGKSYTDIDAALRAQQTGTIAALQGLTKTYDQKTGNATYKAGNIEITTEYDIKNEQFTAKFSDGGSVSASSQEELNAAIKTYLLTEQIELPDGENQTATDSSKVLKYSITRRGQVTVDVELDTKTGKVTTKNQGENIPLVEEENAAKNRSEIEQTVTQHKEEIINVTYTGDATGAKEAGKEAEEAADAADGKNPTIKVTDEASTVIEKVKEQLAELAEKVYEVTVKATVEADEKKSEGNGSANSGLGSGAHEFEEAENALNRMANAGENASINLEDDMKLFLDAIKQIISVASSGADGVYGFADAMQDLAAKAIAATLLIGINSKLNSNNASGTVTNPETMEQELVGVITNYIVSPEVNDPSEFINNLTATVSKYIQADNVELPEIEDVKQNVVLNTNQIKEVLNQNVTDGLSTLVGQDVGVGTNDIPSILAANVQAGKINPVKQEIKYVTVTEKVEETPVKTAEDRNAKTRQNARLQQQGFGVDITATDNATSTLEKVESKVNDFSSTEAQKIITADDTDVLEKVDETKESLESIPNPTVNINGDASSATSAAENVQDAIDALVNGSPYSIEIEVSSSGDVPSSEGEASDTSTKTGTKAKGNVALATGTLMGELGPELVVSGGRYFVVGQNGAEFVDLEDDAIVFNHLQTQQLLKNGMSPSRGKAVTSERNAIAFASGNVNGGPAMASARAALQALKELRAMWQALQKTSIKDLAGKGGGGGGGGGGKTDTPERKAWIEAVERWYNLMQQIAELEREVTHEEALRTKLQSDWQKNGKAYYASQKASLQALEKQTIAQMQLNIDQEDYFNQRRKALNESQFSRLYTFDENGTIQYNDNDLGYKWLADLVTQDEYGNTKYTNEQQYEMIVAQGYGAYMQQDSSGAMIEMEKDENGNLKEDQSAYYAKAIEAWWDTIDSQKEEMESLHETIEEGKTKVLELENSRNEILKEIRDNQMAVEEKVLAAIESSRQREIDALSEERKLLQESTDKYIEGLNESLNKEREMYERNQSDEELNRKQRQLDILRRSGGSGSQIRSLESEISGMQKDSYFDQQQTEIDAIKEASDLQLEKMDQQIEIMTQTLEYQKTMGLLWGDVYTVMDGTPDEITEFIMTHDDEFWDDSPLKTEDQFQEAFFAADQWAAFRDDQAEAYNQDYISHTEDLATMQDAVYGNGSNYNWGIFNESMKRLYGDQWEEVANKYKGQFMSTYAQSGDITKASSDICSALSSFSSSMTSTLNSAYSAATTSASGPSGGSSGGSSSSGGNTSGTKNNKKTTTKYGYQVTFGGSTEKSGKIYDTKAAAEAAGKSVLSNKVIAAGGRTNAQYNAMIKTGSVSTYDLGGIVPKDQLALVHAKESVLTAEQTRVLRNDILGSNPNSLMNLLLDFRSAMSGMASQSDYNTIDRSASMVIEHATVNMNVSSIANDYDARRAGEQALSEMMRIARKTSAKNSVGR